MGGTILCFCLASHMVCRFRDGNASTRTHHPGCPRCSHDWFASLSHAGSVDRIKRLGSAGWFDLTGAHYLCRCAIGENLVSARRSDLENSDWLWFAGPSLHIFQPCTLRERDAEHILCQTGGIWFVLAFKTITGTNQRLPLPDPCQPLPGS